MFLNFFSVVFFSAAFSNGELSFTQFKQQAVYNCIFIELDDILTTGCFSVSTDLISTAFNTF